MTVDKLPNFQESPQLLPAPAKNKTVAQASAPSMGRSPSDVGFSFNDALTGIVAAGSLVVGLVMFFTTGNPSGLNAFAY